MFLCFSLKYKKETDNNILFVIIPLMKNQEQKLFSISKYLKE